MTQQHLPEPITLQQLEAYLWGAANLLRGHMDAGDYKQFIFPLLFWKRLCDVYDEERDDAVELYGEDFPEDHRFQIPEGAHWGDVRAVTTDVGKAIQEAMRSIEQQNIDLLSGIFGDAQWTNKQRLPDHLLRDMMEHFSQYKLTLANVPEDELGQAYEFLIKKFADDSGHTAAEFYTNRTVVHLMTRMLQPQSGDTVYDPTCGSGGMLLSCITELQQQGHEWRNVKLYGQEINLLTSSIARMNLFLHGIADFDIRRADTLSNPAFYDAGGLMQFDVVLANPPYSIKQWDRDAFASDPYGRNLYGTPPQGRADYTFIQHIIASLKPDTGRCAILLPHGVLFRDDEADMREAMIKDDVIECVLGLGPNLFYNSPMEACVLICRTSKPPEQRGQILFINAVNEVTRERAFSFLEDAQIEKILDAYEGWQETEHFARVVTTDEIAKNRHNLNISLYVLPEDVVNNGSEKPLSEVIADWQRSSVELRSSMDELFTTLEDAGLYE